MRLALALVSLAACAPKVSPQPFVYEEDLVTRSSGGAVAIEPERTEERPEAPPGKGLRSGVIPRARLLQVLDAGPGQFLRQLEVTARMSGERFVGWQLVQLIDRRGPLVDVDVAPGDVLLAINGQPIARPDQLQTLWDSLRTANLVTAQLWRGDARLALEFTIEPAVAGAAALPAPAPVSPPPPAETTPPPPAKAPAAPPAKAPAAPPAKVPVQLK